MRISSASSASVSNQWLNRPSPRISVGWSIEARADLRAIDRETAMQILYYVDRYLASRAGDVKKLKSPLTDFRLRSADYRVFFDLKGESTLRITGVRHRREALPLRTISLSLVGLVRSFRVGLATS